MRREIGNSKLTRNGPASQTSRPLSARSSNNIDLTMMTVIMHAVTVIHYSCIYNYRDGTLTIALLKRELAKVSFSTRVFFISLAQSLKKKELALLLLVRGNLHLISWCVYLD
jgi:hypothetical protein